VGVLTEIKGLYTLLNMLALLLKDFKDIKLMLIGNFVGEEAKNDFFQTARQRGLDEQIEFLGYLPYEKMLQRLSQAQVGIALFREGYASALFGKGTARKIFTYMQAGLPIVSTRQGEVALVVEEENCGLLVDATSPPEIAAAVKRLLADSTLARKLGEDGKRAILKKYNWEQEERKILALYDKVGGQPAKPAFTGR
jgi:glycosyltransferase involved in cell wall biosynthesis